MMRLIAELLQRVFAKPGNTQMRDPAIEEVDRRQAEMADRLRRLGVEVDLSRVSEDQPGDHR